MGRFKTASFFLERRVTLKQRRPIVMGTRRRRWERDGHGLKTLKVLYLFGKLKFRLVNYASRINRKILLFLTEHGTHLFYEDSESSPSLRTKTFF